MNRSGIAVRRVCDYFRIEPAELLVVYDELDLPPGTARLKRGGGDAGHHGLHDVIAHMSREFLRLRIGIGRPDSRLKRIDFVLERPDEEAKAQIDSAIAEALEIVPCLIADGEQIAMTRLHTRPSVPDEEDKDNNRSPDKGPN